MAAVLFSDAELHKKLVTLRERGIGLDGVIITDGGEVKFHTAFLACCNNFLFHKYTEHCRGIHKSQTWTINLSHIPYRGVEKIIQYCYNKCITLDDENFVMIMEAALALEFREVIDYGVAFACNHQDRNALWRSFLSVAFRRELSTLPDHHVTHLILASMHVITRRVLLGTLGFSQFCKISARGYMDQSIRRYLRDCVCERLETIGPGITDSDISDSVLCLRNLSSLNENIINLPIDVTERDFLCFLRMSIRHGYPPMTRYCLSLLLERVTLGYHVGDVTACLQEAINNDVIYDVTPMKDYVNLSMVYVEPRSLTADQLSYILAADWLTVPEHELHRFTVDWIEKNQAPVDIQARLLKQIRFGIMRTCELCSIIIKRNTPDEDMSGSTKKMDVEVEKVYLDAMRYVALPHEQPLYTSVINRPRCELPRLYIVGGLTPAFSPSRDLVTLTVRRDGTLGQGGGTDQIPGTNTEMSALFSAGTEIGGFFFLCGGELGAEDTCSDQLWRCNPRMTSQSPWRQMSSMSKPRKYHSCCPLAGEHHQGNPRYLMVAGGYSDVTESEMTIVEMYDVVGDVWCPGPPLPVPSSQHAACCLGGRVYISGGTPGNTLLCISASDVIIASQRSEMTLSSIKNSQSNGRSSKYSQETIHVHDKIQTESSCLSEPYDISVKMEDMPSPAKRIKLSGKNWKPLAPMLHPRQLHAMTSVSSHIYVIGGCVIRGGLPVPVRPVERYDPDTDQWTVLRSVPLPVTMATCVTSGTDVYVFGGSGVQRYDTRGQSWSRCCPGVDLINPLCFLVQEPPINGS